MELTVFTIGYILAAAAAAPPAPAARAAAGPPPPPQPHYRTTQPADYPTGDVEELMQQYQISLGNPYTSSFHRNGDADNYQDGCKKTFGYEQLYEVEDLAGAPRWVVQAANFTQQLRIETCDHRGRLTKNNSLFQNLSECNITCSEESASYNFLVLSRDKKKFEFVRSREIPVNCACRVGACN